MKSIDITLSVLCYDDRSVTQPNRADYLGVVSQNIRENCLRPIKDLGGQLLRYLRTEQQCMVEFCRKQSFYIAFQMCCILNCIAFHHEHILSYSLSFFSACVASIKLYGMLDVPSGSKGGGMKFIIFTISTISLQ